MDSTWELEWSEEWALGRKGGGDLGERTACPRKTHLSDRQAEKNNFYHEKGKPGKKTKVARICNIATPAFKGKKRKGASETARGGPTNTRKVHIGPTVPFTSDKEKKTGPNSRRSKKHREKMKVRHEGVPRRGSPTKKAHTMGTNPGKLIL